MLLAYADSAYKPPQQTFLQAKTPKNDTLALNIYKLRHFDIYF